MRSWREWHYYGKANITKFFQFGNRKAIMDKK